MLDQERMDLDPPKKRRRFFAGAPSISPHSEQIESEIPDSPSSLADAIKEEAVSYDGYSNYAPSDEEDEGAEESEPERQSARESTNTKPEEPDYSTDIAPPAVEEESVADTANGMSSLKLDPDLLAAFLGEQLPLDTLKRLDDVSGGNMERAINMYLDGSWSKQSSLSLSSSSAQAPPSGIGSFFSKDARKRKAESNVMDSTTSAATINAPSKRYIGCLGVEGWATRSGTGLLSHSEIVGIERQKIQPLQKIVKKGKGKAAPVVQTAAASKKRDVVVRFTNSKGEEIGRLPQEKAEFVSTLIDEKICSFTAVCVYCPETIRTGDVIYLQMQCFIVKTAFDSALLRASDNNRVVGPFEARETIEEKALRLRQLALVKLFDEINLQPTKTTSNQQQKRDGLLRGAEIAEAKEKEQSKSTQAPKEGGPPNEEEEEDGKVLEQDQLDQLYKKAQSFDFDSPEAEPASTFTLTLRKYQKQALDWMIGKERDKKDEMRQESMHPLWEEYIWPVKDENDKELPAVVGQEKFYVNPYSGEMSLRFPVQDQHCLGGILADEMGLGKTIEMMSLIHSHRAELQQDGPESSNFVLPRLHLSSDAIGIASRTTLVVAPMSLLSQWASEAEKCSTPGSLKTMVYYGSEKSVDLRAQCCGVNIRTAPNVIITSYGTLLSEFGQYTSGSRSSTGGLFSVEFFRVILDEAHSIKNRTCKTAKACYAINAVHRWVLTGTPIVNRLEDLFSLVRFLRVEPWSNFAFWRTFITVPFESQNFLRALDVVQTVLEPLVMRRTKDMRQPDGTPLVALPPKTILIESIELSEPEREVYDYIFNYVRTSFAANMEAGNVLKSYTTIFAQILRLRQACCHPTLVRKKEIVADEVDAAAAADKESGGLTDSNDLQELIDKFMSLENEAEVNNYGAHALKQIQEEAENECPICSAEPIVDQAVTGCFHMACKSCLIRHIKFQRDQHQTPRCFSCREPINEKDIYEVVRHENEHGELNFKDNAPEISLRRISKASSAKIEALLVHLKRLRREAPGVKSVVFSQFTTFIDLVEDTLKRERILCLRFDGSMSQQQRSAVLSKFKQHQGSIILIVSLKAGGVGLNLTEASSIFVLDPYWSFAVESQAIDRIHRIGQTREVTVHRFIVKNSIEERMVYKIQERKKFIASSLGMMSEEQRRVQRIEDIKDLLGSD